MKQDKIMDAMNFIDDGLIERTEAIRPKKKSARSSWGRWVGVAACLCLFVIGGIGIGRLASWRTGCGRTWHNITIENENMYFSRGKDGVYLYHKSSNTKEKIANFDGVLTQTASGIFLLNSTDGTVYKVTENTIAEMGNIEPNCILIDVISDKIYYRLDDYENGDQIIEADLSTGGNKKLFVAASGHIRAQKIVDKKLYYYIAGYDDAILMLDLESGEQKEIYQFQASENDNANNHVVFYEDIILIQTAQKLFSMKYNDSEAIFLTKGTPASGALDYFEGQLYFVNTIPVNVPGEYVEALVSFDLQSNQMKTVTQLTHGGMTRPYTEIAVCRDGYYYTEPSASGGLYYHSFDGSDEIQISKNK